MEAWGPGAAPVLPRGRKAQALLAYLSMAAGPVPRQELALMLWSRAGPEQARGSLRQALLDMHAALARIPGPPMLVAGRETVTLLPETRWIDAEQVLAADAAQPAALDLLGAPFLAGLDGLDPAFDRWLAQRREALRTAGIELARLLFARTPDDVAARRLLALDPADEAATAVLMAARAQAGQVEEARHALRGLRAALAPLNRAPLPATEALMLPVEIAPRRAPPAPAPAPRRGARLGVLPLQPGPEAGWLAEALAESLTAALSRFRWIFVADSQSLALAVRREGSDPFAVARGQGLDLVLSGHVQLVAGRVRVALRLTDLRPPQSVVWVDRLDRPADSIGGFEEEIAAAVVARVDPALLLLEAQRVVAAAPAAASAYECLLRAIPGLSVPDRAGFEAAGRLLEQAYALDPGFAAAYAWHGVWHIFLIGQGWAADPAQSMRRAETLARRAITLDPSDAQALTICGHIRAYMHHRPEEGAALHDRALALNPNLAMAWALSGLCECYAGRHEEALRRTERYKALAPLHPFGFFFDAAALVPLMLLRRHAECALAARAVCALNPAFSFPLRPWLASLGHLGDTEQAALVRGRLLALEPGLTIADAMRRAPLRPADAAHYAEGLRRAGLEEGNAAASVA